jgi:hypothetical protein
MDGQREFCKLDTLQVKADVEQFTVCRNLHDRRVGTRQNPFALS